MRRGEQELDRRVTLGVATAGVVLMAGLAGWGGSMIALSSADTTAAAASESAGGAVPSVSPTPGLTVPTPTGPADVPNSSTSSTGRTDATPRPSSAPLPAAPPSATRSRTAAASTQASDPPDLAFVSPWRDYGSGQWYYRVGLIGFPADTPVEISGHDVHGNVLVAPLVLTTAEGWWNPFTTGFATNFAYGGTCGAAQSATVTARGAGFTVTETVPRPLECEGGTTPNGPWTPAVTPSPSPTMPPPSAGSGGG